MERSHCVRRQNVCLVASDLHRYSRRAGEQGREEDLVLHDDVGTRGRLPGRVSCGAVAGACGCGGQTVPELELLLLRA